jgi:hypothetical protein
MSLAGMELEKIGFWTLALVPIIPGSVSIVQYVLS